MIYPAIDLRQGQVVRLQLGDPARQTMFGDDPMATAVRWITAGATWLHVVNLDGAFDEDGAANWRRSTRADGLGARCSSAAACARWTDRRGAGRAA